jgi:hypothetical protein
MPSSVARADTIVKLISAFPFLADTNLALTEAGFDMDQVREINAEKSAALAEADLQSILSASDENTEVVEYENVDKESDETVG